MIENERGKVVTDLLVLDSTWTHKSSTSFLLLQNNLCPKDRHCLIYTLKFMSGRPNTTEVLTSSHRVRSFHLPVLGTHGPNNTPKWRIPLLPSSSLFHRTTSHDDSSPTPTGVIKSSTAISRPEVLLLNPRQYVSTLGHSAPSFFCQV